jgi:hypothetical protein
MMKSMKALFRSFTAALLAGAAAAAAPDAAAQSYPARPARTTLRK